MKLTDAQLLDLASFAFLRLDGAWFLATAEKQGRDAAWDLDVEAWRKFSYLLGKRLAALLAGTEGRSPQWPDSFLWAQEVLWRLMNIRGRKVEVDGPVITVATADCEVQRMIAKAGVADCGIATRATYQGLAKGLFGKDFEIRVDHLKNLNRGADECRVAITAPEARPVRLQPIPSAVFPGEKAGSKD